MLLSKTPTDEAALAATALDVKINVQSFIIICRLNAMFQLPWLRSLWFTIFAQAEDLHVDENQWFNQIFPTFQSPRQIDD